MQQDEDLWTKAESPPDCALISLTDLLLGFFEAVIQVQRHCNPLHSSQRGCERGYFNEAMKTLQFAERRRWAWKKPGHINVLEVHSLLGLVQDIAKS